LTGTDASISWNWIIIGVCVGWIAPGCGDPGPARREVVVYSALDREFADPRLEAYARSSGVVVRSKYDIESTKTVGLTNLLIAEAGRPRCDLFWNNEILNTIRLSEKGLLAPFRPTRAGELPPTFRAADATWYGFAARGRILIVNTELVAAADRPRSIFDLVDLRWKGKVGIAKPLAGTTATHAACLFAARGEAEARKFFLDLKANEVAVLSGNKQVATAVGSGQLAFGLTDTDDAMGEIDAGRPVAIVYPDRDPDRMGTLFIPNTLAILRGAPHRAEAEALADHLLSPAVEAALAEGPGAQIPLLQSTRTPARVETPATVHAMDVDFAQAARLWDGVALFLEAEFGGN